MIIWFLVIGRFLGLASTPCHILPIHNVKHSPTWVWHQKSNQLVLSFALEGNHKSKPYCRIIMIIINTNSSIQITMSNSTVQLYCIYAHPVHILMVIEIQILNDEVERSWLSKVERFFAGSQYFVVLHREVRAEDIPNIWQVSGMGTITHIEHITFCIK